MKHEIRDSCNKNISLITVNWSILCGVVRRRVLHYNLREPEEEGLRFT